MPKESVIINAVPCNAGDELLLRNAITLCSELGYETKCVLSNQVHLLGDFDNQFIHWHDLDISAEIDYRHRVPTFARKKVARLSKRLASAVARASRGESYNKSLSFIKSADAVFSSAGGYLNSRYGYTKRLGTFETILDAGKKLILLPQSIGPFSPTEDHSRLSKALSRATAVLVRDAQSIRNIERIGVDLTRVRQLPDLGLARLQNSVFSTNTKASSQILVSVREWKYDITTDELIDKFRKLAEHLCRTLGTKIIFASTCQGREGYIDDSNIAKQIVAKCATNVQSKMTVIDKTLTCHEYIDLGRKCDMYIGMRLHGAIMSLQAGIPAFAIGYEEKTKEIFTDIDLPDCFVEALDPIDHWISRLSLFIENLDTIKLRSHIAINRNDFLMGSYASKIVPLLLD